jgi:DNA-binding GntR family transcriptional regulator
MGQKTTRTRALVDRAYAYLKEMILYHEVKPGQRLQDRDLAQSIGVSRTPVREALSRLERDGLVINLEGRGYFVREIDRQEVEHLYDLRELVECHAMGLAVKHARPEDIEELAKMLDAIEALGNSAEGRAEGVKLGIRIHEIVGRASGNPWMHQTMIRLLDQLLFCIWTEAWLETSAELEATRREHRAYLRVLQAKSATKGRALVRTHVRRAKAQFLRMLKAREAFYGQSDSGHMKPHRGGNSLSII